MKAFIKFMKSKAKKLLALVLAVAAVLAFGLLPAFAPITASAAMPTSGSLIWDGVDFTELTNPANKIYYGAYKHRTGLLSGRDSETRPVLWRVMGEEAGDGAITLFSEYVLDNHSFHETATNGANYYDASGIYRWLTDEFRKEIFPAPEHNAGLYMDVMIGMYESPNILSREITGSYSVGSYNYPNSLPWDSGGKIYLPWGLNTYLYKGVYWTAGNDKDLGKLAENIGTYRNGTAAAYWTRSAAYNNATQAISVSATGSLVSTGVTLPLGVRPAYKLNPARIIFASEIKTSANTAIGETAADGTNYAAPADGTKNFKLTLESIDLSTWLEDGGTLTTGGDRVSSYLTKTVVPGGTVAIAATKAPADTKLTYKIVNSSGAIVGYGQGVNTALTVNAKNLSGADLPVGDYKVYIWPQKNNDKSSHEGSVPRNFTLKVAPQSAAAPIIGTQPTGTTYTRNTAATALKVAATASDGGTLSYQWYSNTTSSTSGGMSLGTANGARTASYTPPTTTAGTVYYYCVVTNTNNKATNSKTATATSKIVAVNIVVDAATPNITEQPSAAVYNTNDNSVVALTVAAAVSDGGALSYQWYSNDTNDTVTPATLNNTTTSYTPSTATDGTTYYYCVVTNTNNNVSGNQTVSATSSIVPIVVGSNVGLSVNGTGTYTTIDTAKSAIDAALLNDNTVTVAGGLSGNGAAETLNLVIPGGKTVVWQAVLVSPATAASISGGGTLDVAGGSLRTYGTTSTSTIDVAANTTLKVSGGMVEAVDSPIAAIKLTGTGARADITAGEVKAVYRAIDCQNGGIVSVSGGAVSSKTADIATIMVNGASTVEISGTATIRNTVTTGSRTIQAASGSTAAVSITGGTVIGQSLIYGGTVHISGGSVYIPTGNALTLYESGNAVITGGTIRVLANGTQQIITRDSGHNGAGYYIGEDFYIGDRAKLFSGFTAGNNLFALDAAPALTTGGGNYTYASTPSVSPVVATLSDKLVLTGASVVASTGNPLVNLSANTATFNTGVNSTAITLAVTGAKFTGMNIPFDFTTAGFSVNVAKTDVSGNISYTPNNLTYNGSELMLNHDAALNGVTADENPQWDYTYDTDGTVSPNNASISIDSPLNAGSYILTIDYEDDSSKGTKKVEFAVNKANQTRPDAPTLSDNTNDSITLTPNALYEFSMDGSSWYTNNVFSGLTANVEYTFYQRLAETGNYNASMESNPLTVTAGKAALGGTVSITGTEKYGETLTADTALLSSIPDLSGTTGFGTLSYQWRRDGANITVNGTGATYQVAGADIGQAITVTVTAENATGSVTSGSTGAVAKATPTAADLDWALPGAAENGSAWPVTVTAGSGVTGLGAITVLYSGNQAAPKLEGSYPLSVNIAEGDNYSAVSGLGLGVSLNIAASGTPLTDDIITIGGENRALTGNQTGINWSYDADTKTLTLTGDLTDGININTGPANEITVAFTGDVTISPADGSALKSTGPLRLQGADGKTLTVISTGGPAIEAAGVTVTGGAVDASTSADGASAIESGGGVTINGTAEVKAKGTGMDSGGIKSLNGDINITESAKVTAEATGAAAAIEAASGAVTINGGTSSSVSAYGGAQGISSYGGLTVTGDSSVNAITDDNGNAALSSANGGVSISGNATVGAIVNGPGGAAIFSGGSGGVAISGNAGVSASGFGADSDGIKSLSGGINSSTTGTVSASANGGGYAYNASPITITSGTTELSASDDAHAMSVTPDISGSDTIVKVNGVTVYEDNSNSGGNNDPNQNDNSGGSGGGGCSAGAGAGTLAFLTVAALWKRRRAK